MFYSNSHGTAPGKVKVHLYFWLARAIGKTLRELWLNAINALAGLSGDEDDRAVDRGRRCRATAVRSGTEIPPRAQPGAGALAFNAGRGGAGARSA